MKSKNASGPRQQRSAVTLRSPPRHRPRDLLAAGAISRRVGGKTGGRIPSSSANWLSKILGEELPGCHAPGGNGLVVEDACSHSGACPIGARTNHSPSGPALHAAPQPNLSNERQHGWKHGKYWQRPCAPANKYLHPAMNETNVNNDSATRPPQHIATIAQCKCACVYPFTPSGKAGQMFINFPPQQTPPYTSMIALHI